MNDYKELVDELKKYTYWLGQSGPESHEIHPIVCDKAVNAIEELVSGIESLSKELFELKIILDMYGGEDGITEAFKKAEELSDAKRDIEALIWLNGDCKYCKYGEKESYSGAERWNCKLGNTIDCRPEWRGDKK